MQTRTVPAAYTKIHTKNGKLHKEDGAAVVYANGTEEYWLDGIKYLDIKAYAKVAGWTDKQLVEYLLCKS